MKIYLRLLLALATGLRAQEHGEEASEEMGPVAFMWPPDRPWGAAYDNRAPCGSNSEAVNRTEFPLPNVPLVNGQLALVIQEDSWNVQIAVSHKNNPTSNDDFEIFVERSEIKEVDPGHMCYPVPSPSIDSEPGMNATFQIRYTSDADTDKNETYYACTDVTYVATSQFKFQVPCFNVTSDEFTSIGSSDSDDDDKTTDKPSSSNLKGESADNNSGGGGGLSGGAIAGIVIGCVAAAAITAIILFGYRRLLQKYRGLRQKTSPRNVDWTADEGAKPPMDTSLNSSYGLRKLK